MTAPKTASVKLPKKGNYLLVVCDEDSMYTIEVNHYNLVMHTVELVNMLERGLRLQPFRSFRSAWQDYLRRQSRYTDPEEGQ